MPEERFNLNEIITQILKLSEQSYRRGFTHGARFQKDFGVSEDQINVWRNETPLACEVVIPVGSETQFIEKSLFERVRTEIAFKEEFSELLKLIDPESEKKS